jgi:hypothetical protein
MPRSPPRPGRRVQESDESEVHTLAAHAERPMLTFISESVGPKLSPMTVRVAPPRGGRAEDSSAETWFVTVWGSAAWM